MQTMDNSHLSFHSLTVIDVINTSNHPDRDAQSIAHLDTLKYDPLQIDSDIYIIMIMMLMHFLFK